MVMAESGGGLSPLARTPVLTLLRFVNSFVCMYVATVCECKVFIQP